MQQVEYEPDIGEPPHMPPYGYGGDRLAAIAATQTTPPEGRIHLHLFVRGTKKVRVTDNNNQFVRWEREFTVQWRVSRRASLVCRIPGRCVLADVLPQELQHGRDN